MNISNGFIILGQNLKPCWDIHLLPLDPHCERWRWRRRRRVLPPQYLSLKLITLKSGWRHRVWRGAEMRWSWCLMYAILATKIPPCKLKIRNQIFKWICFQLLFNYCKRSLHINNNRNCWIGLEAKWPSK